MTTIIALHGVELQILFDFFQLERETGLRGRYEIENVVALTPDITNLLDCFSVDSVIAELEKRRRESIVRGSHRGMPRKDIF